MRKILCKKLRPWTNYVASLHVSRFLLGGRIHVEIFTIPLGKTNYASVRMWTVLTQVMMASITEQVGQLADKHELSGLFSNAVPQVLYFTPFISLDLQELTNFVTTIGESWHQEDLRSSTFEVHASRCHKFWGPWSMCVKIYGSWTSNLWPICLLAIGFMHWFSSKLFQIQIFKVILNRIAGFSATFCLAETPRLALLHSKCNHGCCLSVLKHENSALRVSHFSSTLEGWYDASVVQLYGRTSKLIRVMIWLM